MAVMLAAAIHLRAAQLDTNTVTVTATRTYDLQPDQVQLYVTLTAPVAVGLDEILAQLEGSGITAANLNGVYTPYSNASDEYHGYSQWSFTPTVGFDKLKAALAALSRLQITAGKFMESPALRFDVGGTKISYALLAAHACPFPTLIDDARRQADAMAAAAGMRTGAIVSLSDGSSVDPIAAGPIAGFSAAGGAGGPFFLPGGFSPSAGPIGTIFSPGCSLTVQFELLP